MIVILQAPANGDSGPASPAGRLQPGPVRAPVRDPAAHPGYLPAPFGPQQGCSLLARGQAPASPVPADPAGPALRGRAARSGCLQERTRAVRTGAGPGAQVDPGREAPAPGEKRRRWRYPRPAGEGLRAAPEQRTAPTRYQLWLLLSPKPLQILKGESPFFKLCILNFVKSLVLKWTDDFS